MPPINPTNNAGRAGTFGNQNANNSNQALNNNVPLNNQAVNPNAAADALLMKRAEGAYRRFQVEAQFTQRTAPTATTSVDVPRAELEARAKRLFERFSDDGTLGLSPTTEYREIAAELNGLTANDAKLLRDIYQQTYSPQRGGRDLLMDVAVEIPKLEDRIRAFEVLAPERIIRQDAPQAANSQRAGISTEPQLAEIVTGTPITYRFNEGATIKPLNAPPPFVSYLVRNPDGSNQTLTGAKQETNYDQPGVYRVAFEVFSSPTQPPVYYTMRQVVRAPEVAAHDALLSLSGTAPDAELYLSFVDMQIGNIEQRLTGLRAEADQLKPRSFFEAETPRFKQLTAEIRTLETGLAQLKQIKETLPGKLFDGAAGKPVPLQAVLIPTEQPQGVPLQLYAKPLGGNRWAIVDATSPSNARVYQGTAGATQAEGLQSAWAEFIANNTLPAGQIAARPPQGFGAPEIWNAKSDGQSGLQQWANGLGWGSLALAALGVASLFGPGTQIAAPYLFGGAGVLGAASGGANIADRVTYGNFELFSQATAIDALAIVGGMASTGGATATLLRAGRTTVALADGTSITLSQADKLGKFVTIANTVDLTAGVTNGLVIGATHLQQIERINADPTLSPEQKRQHVQAVMTQAVATGGLIVLGHGLGTRGVQRQAVNAVADSQAALNNMARSVPTHEIDALLVKHGGARVRWAASEIDGVAARRLLTELDATTLQSLQAVSGKQAFELLNVFGKDQLTQVASQVGAQRLQTMVELLGADTAKGVVAEKVRTNKINQLQEFADNLSAARLSGLDTPKPLGAKSVIVDNNVLTAISDLQKGADWASLPVRYQNSINQVRAQVGLPALTTNPSSRTMTGILGTADVRVPNTVIGEAQANPNVSRSGIELSVSRSDAAYTRVLRELETPPPVGGNKGFADRAAIADALFAKTSGGQLPRFVTGDIDVLKHLVRYTKPGMITPKPNESVYNSILRTAPNGFEIEIGGRKLLIVPVSAK